MDEEILNKQKIQEQSIFEPSEVINIDYWLMQYNEKFVDSAWNKTVRIYPRESFSRH